MIAVIAATATLLIPAQTLAHEPGYRLSGGLLLESCSAGDLSAQTKCAYYISGVADQMALQGVIEGHLLLCMPPETSAVRMRDIVLAYLRKDSANLNLPASIYVWRALLDVYPCKGAYGHIAPADPDRP